LGFQEFVKILRPKDSWRRNANHARFIQNCIA
jgi:hypothetical protein